MRSMITNINKVYLVIFILLYWSCNQSKNNSESMQANNSKTAKEILGNPSYQAISYGGYRKNSREHQPRVEQLKEDLRITHAMGIRVLRTYNVQLPHASNVLKAIKELKSENPEFEMYVMLGAWIDCLNAWTDLEPDHNVESPLNVEEIDRAVALVKKYPDIVKVLAVGNEAMVKWASAYYVQPGVILKWVNHLQDLKKKGELPKELWITSSDNFASWGGGGKEYHVKDLEKLIKAVDFISMHTYPMHDTHYNPVFWASLPEEKTLSKADQIRKAMKRALEYSVSQYDSVRSYVDQFSPGKPIHIGETGWASSSNELYGKEGSKATDEFKEGIYNQLIREWTDSMKMSCFYFEAFDEPWKDAGNPGGSENHFGLFTVDGKAKYAIWNLVDQGVFKGLKRDGNEITKTYNGDEEELLKQVELPPRKTTLELTE